MLKGNQVQVVKMDNLTQLFREHIRGCIAITANRHGFGHAEKRLVALCVSLWLQNRQCAHGPFGRPFDLNWVLACFPLDETKILHLDPF
jgi:hypothetical protein